MTQNEITGQMELNIAESHLLGRIDDKCRPNNPIQVDVNDQPATIRADRSGFIAQTVWNNELQVAYGVRASVAFLNLVKRLQGVK